MTTMQLILKLKCVGLKKNIYDLLGEIYEATMLFGILNTFIANVTRYSFDIFFKHI